MEDVLIESIDHMNNWEGERGDGETMHGTHLYRDRENDLGEFLEWITQNLSNA